MEAELTQAQKENNTLELRVAEEHKKLKAKEKEMIMERTKVQYICILFADFLRRFWPISPQSLAAAIYRCSFFVRSI